MLVRRFINSYAKKRGLTGAEFVMDCMTGSGPEACRYVDGNQLF